MLPLVDVFGITIADKEFSILLILLAAIIVAAIIFFVFKLKGPPRIKSREDLYSQFAKLGDRKAKLKSKLAAIEETKNYGRMAQSEYNEQLTRTQDEIGSINIEMDEILKTLASPHYEVKLQQERGLETEKMSLLVKLQEETNAGKSKVTELEATVDDITRRNEILEAENAEFKQKLDNLETTYKNRVIAMERELDAAKKNVSRKSQPNPGNPGSEDMKKYKEKVEEYYHRIQLYQLLVSRYKEQIDTNEVKSVQDVKSLVQPGNSNVTQIVQRIKAETTEYMRQYQGAFESIDEVHSVPSIGTTFWLSVKEMLDNKVADYEDKAILLCSILRGLGASSRVLVASLTDGSNRPLVMITLKDKTILLDPNKKHEFLQYVGKRNDAIKQFKIDGKAIKRILYEFNDKDYISYEL